MTLAELVGMLLVEQPDAEVVSLTWHAGKGGSVVLRVDDTPGGRYQLRALRS